MGSVKHVPKYTKLKSCVRKNGLKTEINRKHEFNERHSQK